MPLTDRDPNTSGRTSSASNLSTGSRGMPKATAHGGGVVGKSDLLSTAAPGVMSMLRTSTELGDICGLSYDTSSTSNVPRAPPRRGGASSRLSTASSHSNASRRTSNHQARPSASSGARRSLTRETNVPQYVADTLSPTIVNLPGSSPLIPRSRNSRDGNGRSFSMTYTSQPTFRLSSNRSLASLRSHDPIQRPQSPYRYPTRLRRPGYRPASPALSDVSGTQLRRSHGHPPHRRLRTPSDMSVHRDDRGYRPPRPNRSHSPNFMAGPHSEIPPVPPLHHHIVVEQARVARTHMQGSVSSGSTNQRSDSDAPSSDGPSPPTPKDGQSMEVLVSPSATRVLVDSTTGVGKGDVTTGPLYYDYSEQFERDQYAEPEPETIPTGFVNRIKTILEDRVTVEHAPRKRDAPMDQETIELPVSEIVSIANISELPASPVPRRITRDMVLAALEPVSTTEDVDMSAMTSQREEPDSTPMKGTTRGAPVKKETCKDSCKDEEVDDKRRSAMSEAASRLVDSSTVDVAVRYSVPMAGSTEDGMSDLLDGYQHTESKESTEPLPKGGQMEIVHMEAVSSEPPAERKSHHTPKSSDAQSFKSCTDLAEPPPVKDSDARSFTTCKDAVTPERPISMPHPSFPSMIQAKPETQMKRPFSEMPLSPISRLRKHPLVPPRESSFSKAHSRRRANSKLSSRHGSTQASLSLSVEAIQQPPSVPPRDSSSSKEAQRSQAVADFLVRLSRTRRFSKARSSASKKSSKDEMRTSGIGDKFPKLDSNLDPNSSSKEALVPELSSEKMGACDSTALKQVSVTEEPIPTPPSFKDRSVPKEVLPVKKPRVVTGSPSHQHSMSTPSPILAEPSSVYSPEDISFKSRVQSSPLALPPKTPDHSPRDSQTTTHLVWHGRRSLNLHHATVSEPRLNQDNGQDETTTDLRLSAYRYPQHYLPDLKEESHEDSSLNTSASNMRNSSFKFPFGGQPTSVRASVDGGIMFGRTASTKSYRKSSLGHTRGLPSMNFSRMDLIAKLNEALDMPPSKSLDGVPDDVHELDGAGLSTARPTSVGEIREKYRSFFASLDQLEKSGDVQARATIMDLMPLKHPYSPNELMAEIDKLTIPSVGGLTQRLSEFLPSLKEYYKLENADEFLAEQVIMEHALEELNGVGGPVPKRSSARLRPMPGSPNLVVIDDGLYEELTGKERENLTVDGIDDSGDTSREGVASGRGRRGRTRHREKTPLAELEAPSPAVLRTRSLSVGHQDLRPSLESRLSTRRSLRSLVSTPTTTTDTRPWNSDKNYPWATTLPSIDISLPAPTAVRDSARQGPPRSSARLSEPSDVSESSPETAVSPTVFIPLTPSDDPHTHSRKQSNRLSFFSHSSRKNNAQRPPSPGFDASGFPTGPVNVRGGDHTHSVGERYPTTALSSPLNAANVAISRFSPDISDEDEHPTHDRMKPALLNRRRGGNRITRQDQRSPSQEALRSPRRETFEDASGMSSGRYRLMRFQQNLKKLWGKLKRPFHRSAKGPGDTATTNDKANSKSNTTAAEGNPNATGPESTLDAPARPVADHTRNGTNDTKPELQIGTVVPCVMRLPVIGALGTPDIVIQEIPSTNGDAAMLNPGARRQVQERLTIPLDGSASDSQDVGQLAASGSGAGGSGAGSNGAPVNGHYYESTSGTPGEASSSSSDAQTLPVRPPSDNGTRQPHSSRINSNTSSARSSTQRHGIVFDNLEGRLFDNLRGNDDNDQI